MTQKTYADLLAKIEKDLDIEDELFVQDSELMEYFNDAIRACESQIHKLGLEDLYFKTSDNPSLVIGTADYSMPSNIYQNKIVEVVFNDGSKVFEIKRLKGSNKHVRKAYIDNDSGSDPLYLYDIVYNTAAAGIKFKLIPASKITNSTYVTRWYIREATRMTLTTSVCDLPDACLNFVYAYVSWRIWGKEGDPRVMGAQQERDKQEMLMVETLAEMTPDDDNEVEKDLSYYDEAT